MFSLEAFWTSQDRREHYRDVLLVISFLLSWLAHSPSTAAVLQEMGPEYPHGCDQCLTEQRGWNCLQVLASKTWSPEGDWKSWTGPSAPAPTLQPKPHEKRLVMQRGSMQCISPQCFLRPDFIQCTAQASPFPHNIWTEPHQQCPGSDRWPSLYCNPSCELTQDEKHQMTGYRVPRAGSRGFFCRHLAGCFKVFCL